MSIDEIYEILIEGTREQLESLTGSGVSYSYGPRHKSFSLWDQAAQEGIRGCKLFDTPNCVKIYGNEHVF